MRLARKRIRITAAATPEMVNYAITDEESNSVRYGRKVAENAPASKLKTGFARPGIDDLIKRL